MVGYDIDADAIAITKAHLRNAAIRGAWVELVNADVRGATGTFDTIVVNLPWGTSVGSHAENPSLYSDVLATAATLGPRLFVLTHEIKVFEATLDEQSAWSIADEHRFFQKGHWPRLFTLTKL